MKLVNTLIGALLCAGVHAAPDELTLGKERGYPLCPCFDDQACLMALWGRLDEVAPARGKQFALWEHLVTRLSQ